jgi:hypothetical protein
MQEKESNLPARLSNSFMRRAARSAGLPGWLAAQLERPPARGEGLHQWLFSTARQLHAHLTAEEIVNLLLEITEGERREVEDAVFNSESCAWRPERDWRDYGTRPRPRPRQPPQPDARATTGAAKPRWPKPNLSEIKSIAWAGMTFREVWKRLPLPPGAPTGLTLAGLRKLSPLALDQGEGEPDCAGKRFSKWVLGQLFTPDDLICLGVSVDWFEVHPLKDWPDRLWRAQFIVPSAMTAQTGLTLGGKASPHCLANTGPRGYLVLEFDKLNGQPMPVDWQSAIIWHLSEFLPLAMVVWSGGKSLQAWFPAQGEDEGALRRFMEYAASLGADPATWTRCQFVRLPDGTRQPGGQRQWVRYFSREALL